MIPKILTIWFGFLVMFLFSNLSAEEHQPSRIAILSADKSAWADLLMARLSAKPELALVERDDLGKALNEVELKELLGVRKKRSRFGEIVGADFLILLDVVSPHVRLVVCDTRLGVSLEDFRMQFSEEAQDKTLDILVGTVLRTLNSFEGGVRNVVAVPDFICRDLTFDHAYLQRDYATALQAAYRQIPGTAIVAVEEAKAIATERDLAPGKPRERLVSTFIEGEFRTSRDLKTNRHAVEIVIRARNGSEAPVEKKLPSIAISQSFKPLIDCLEEKAFKLSAPVATKLDEEAQYRFLLERANAFGTLADYANSTSLREAALLLRPDDDKNRIKLIEDYKNQELKQLHFDKDFWPKGARLDASNPEWLAAMSRSIDDWQRSMQHCAYLVENRRVSRERACTLADWAFNSSPNMYDGWCLTKSDFNEVQDNFIRYTMSQIAYLDPEKPGERRANTDWKITSTIFDSIGEYRDSADSPEKKLDLIAELLLERLPHSFTLSEGLCIYINSWVSVKQFQEHLPKFAERMLQSNRPVARAYGYYVIAQLGAVKGRPDSELLIMAENAVHELDLLDFPGQPGVVQGAFIRGLAKNIKKRLEEKSRAPVIQDDASPRSVPKLPEPLVRLERVHLKLTNKGNMANRTAEFIQKNDFARKCGMGSVRNPNRFRAIGEGLDIMWSPGAVFFIGAKGEATEVFADENMIIADVVHDGQYIWSAAYNGWGLAVFDKSGKLLARIDEKQGLPPCRLPDLVAHPISHGCIMVSGSFSSGKRSWIAIVRFDGKESSVDVVLEATHTRGVGYISGSSEPDELSSFRPNETYEHVIPGPLSRRLIFINGWVTGKPIKVKDVPIDTWIMPDPVTSRIGKYPEGNPNTKNNNFANVDGTLWVAGGDSCISGYQYENSTGKFKVVNDKFEWAATLSPSMAHHGDWLYFAGSKKWLRYNLRTFEEQILVDDVKALNPDVPHHSNNIWNSAQYGLVACFGDSDSLYQVILLSENKD